MSKRLGHSRKCRHVFSKSLKIALCVHLLETSQCSILVMQAYVRACLYNVHVYGS